MSSIANSLFNQGIKTSKNVLNNLLGVKDKKTLYKYPNDVDIYYDNTYMVIEIYDDNKNINGVKFTPFKKQNVGSILQEVSKNWQDLIILDKTGLSSQKATLQKYSNEALDYIKNHLQSAGNWILSGFGYSSADLSGIVNPLKDIDNSWIGKVVKNISSVEIAGLKIGINVDKIKDIISTTYGPYISSLKDKYSQYEDKETKSSNVQYVGSICLGLPNNDYTRTSSVEINPTETDVAATIMGALNSFISAYNSSDGFLSGISNGAQSAVQSLGTNLSGRSAELAYGLLGSQGKALFQKNYGKIYYPLYYFAYSLPSPRDFQFDYMFAPRNSAEMYDAWNIIRMLEFYSLGNHLVDSVKDSKGNETAATMTYMTLPARFRVKFYTNSVENTWYGKTKLLGLEKISYTIPRDTSYISDDKGNGNVPRVFSLSLSFKELSIRTRDDISNGY